MNKKLYVVTAHFNPSRFRSRARLWRAFERHMQASGVQLLTVEAAFGEHDFEVTTSTDPWNVQLRTSCVLWHKERMVNIGLQRLFQLVPDARYVGWFDADITFVSDSWAEDAVHKLQHCHVIQPFAEAINLSKSEEFMWNCPSSIRSFLEARDFHQDPPVPLNYLFAGHPGLAWAATRQALDSLGGLYEVCAAGSGDTVMANALKGGWDVYLPAPPSPGMVASMRRWAGRCDSHIKTKLGFVRGSLLHHWHGASGDRGYERRWSILSFHQFDPDSDLVIDSSGLYRWAGNKPRLEDDIRLSLTSRNEDL